MDVKEHPLLSRIGNQRAASCNKHISHCLLTLLNRKNVVLSVAP